MPFGDLDNCGKEGAPFTAETQFPKARQPLFFAIGPRLFFSGLYRLGNVLFAVKPIRAVAALPMALRFQRPPFARPDRGNAARRVFLHAVRISSPASIAALAAVIDVRHRRPAFSDCRR